DKSKYVDFFIDWNKFWEGNGTLGEDGYLIPDKKYLDKMFFRKPGMPILMIHFPDGRDVPYWNTFYQQVIYNALDPLQLVSECGLQYETSKMVCDLINPQLNKLEDLNTLDFGNYTKYEGTIKEYLNSHRSYLGQMDLNIKSPLVWDYYEETLKKLADYGVSIVRLDAFAYGPKEVGEPNFLNDPGTWDLLKRIDDIASPLKLKLLPEIHASYEEKIYATLANKGYMVYDFFLPGLIIDAFERGNGDYLKKWADEIIENHIHTVNMLGCHDGIPLLDLKGLLSEEDIKQLIDVVVKRGGYVKNLHGAQNTYYQVNATYYSALGEDDQRMMMARAIQLFMPGKPQIWYLDLLAGKNDYEAMAKAGVGGHKEINRTNIHLEELDELLSKKVVKDQLDLLRFRNTYPAFKEDAKVVVNTEGSTMCISWESDEAKATLKVDFEKETFEITKG
ncbi:MAG: glycosidase, partial [Erysipelotrichaceae bacterium]|nr:glycosidase [Erysipelotrichaceae bacterium]